MSFRKYAEIGRWTLIPKARAKPQSDYIPEKLRIAYYQACVIQDVNPRASAVMSRYCLQEMLCDFWGLPKTEEETLAATLEAVAEKLSLETLEAIETVRRFGNINSFTNEDVRMMVEASPEEAALLIDLVETLFKDFYEDRHRREERAAALRNIAEAHIKQSGNGFTALLPTDVKPVSSVIKRREERNQQKTPSRRRKLVL